MSCDHCSRWPGSSTDHPPTPGQGAPPCKVWPVPAGRCWALLRSSARDASWLLLLVQRNLRQCQGARACSARRSVFCAAPRASMTTSAHRPPLGVDQGSAGIKADVGRPAPWVPGEHRVLRRIQHHHRAPPLRGSGAQRLEALGVRGRKPHRRPQGVSPRLRNAAPPWVRQRHGLPAARSAPAAPAGRFAGRCGIRHGVRCSRKPGRATRECRGGR